MRKAHVIAGRCFAVPWQVKAVNAEVISQRSCYAIQRSGSTKQAV
jgi:hypothetical protein